MSQSIDPNFEYDPAVFQELVNMFRELQVLLEAIVDNACMISSWQDRYQFSFEHDEQTGLIQSISSSCNNSNAPYYADIVNDHKEFCEETGGLLHDHLQRYHELNVSLLTALDTLPRPLQDRLSDVRGGKHWVTLVSRFIMLPISRWPRLPSRETWQPNRSLHPKRPSIPDRVDRLLEYYSETDPTREWQKVCRRIDSFVDDIIAVAWAFGSLISREPDGPSDPYTWRHQGIAIDDKMTPKAWRLVKHLFSNRSSLVPFSALADSVFQDHAIKPDYSMVSTLRYEANKFFEKHEVPWIVKTSESKWVQIAPKAVKAA